MLKIKVRGNFYTSWRCNAICRPHTYIEEHLSCQKCSLHGRRNKEIKYYLSTISSLVVFVAYTAIFNSVGKESTLHLKVQATCKTLKIPDCKL